MREPRRQSSVWPNASHRFRRLLIFEVPPSNKHGLRLPAVNVNEFHSLTSQEFPPSHRSRSPRTPVRRVRDFLLATRSLSFEFETPKSTNFGTAYRAASKEIPTLVSIFAFGVSRVRGVTLMANDSRCRRQAVLLYKSRVECDVISGVRD